jgi:SAM-dependent methyltransferase
LSAIRRVLDVGCGPGTNTRHFAHTDYLGLDMNLSYIASARRRHRREFVATDVRDYVAPPDSRFDFILVNSFLHHIDLAATRRILAHLSTLLTDDGHVHILDLVMPETPSLARTLASWDRGEFPRGIEEWRQILTESFAPVVFEPYSLELFGVTLWKMLYFKGKPRT